MFDGCKSLKNLRVKGYEITKFGPIEEENDKENRDGKGCGCL